MTMHTNAGNYPLVPATEYLDILNRYKDIPNIRPQPQAKEVSNPEIPKQKENFWKVLFNTKNLINVWLPTTLTVAGTIIGAIVGAKCSTPKQPANRHPKGVIENYVKEDTNTTTYVFTHPTDSNIQFAVIGKTEQAPKAYWIATNENGLKAVSEAKQIDQVILAKE